MKKVKDLIKNAFKKIKDRFQKKRLKTKISKGINSNSKRVQFPVNEKLSDGRHRYYVKYGQKIDRLIK